jgi:hypothetical protein
MYHSVRATYSNVMPGAQCQYLGLLVMLSYNLLGERNTRLSVRRTIPISYCVMVWLHFCAAD